MPYLDSKSWTTNIINDETSTETASLLRVLEGVAVATNAPDEYIQPLVWWLSQYGVTKDNNSFSSSTPTDTEITFNLALPFVEWYEAITSTPENTEAGCRDRTTAT